MERERAGGDGRGRVFDGRAEMPKDATVGQSIDRSVVTVGRRQEAERQDRASERDDGPTRAATASGRLEPNKRWLQKTRERGLEGGRRREAGLARASAEAQTAGGDKRLIPPSVYYADNHGHSKDSETRRGCPRVVAGVNWLPVLTGWKGERARKRERETGRQASNWDGMQREKWPAYLWSQSLVYLVPGRPVPVQSIVGHWSMPYWSGTSGKTPWDPLGGVWTWMGREWTVGSGHCPVRDGQRVEEREREEKGRETRKVTMCLGGRECGRKKEKKVRSSAREEAIVNPFQKGHTGASGGTDW